MQEGEQGDDETGQRGVIARAVMPAPLLAHRRILALPHRLRIAEYRHSYDSVNRGGLEPKYTANLPLFSIN